MIAMNNKAMINPGSYRLGKAGDRLLGDNTEYDE